MSDLYLCLANMLKNKSVPLLKHVEAQELRFYSRRYSLEGLYG